MVGINGYYAIKGGGRVKEGLRRGIEGGGELRT
jgi:hypothetical protein